MSRSAERTLCDPVSSPWPTVRLPVTRSSTSAGSIAASGTPRKAKWWVQRLGKRPLHEAVTASLADRGVITVEQGRTLGTFPTTNYPEQHGRPEAVLRPDFADVPAGWAQPTPFADAVIGLLDATDTLRKQFGAVDRARRRDRHRQLGEPRSEGGTRGDPGHDDGRDQGSEHSVNDRDCLKLISRA